MYRIFFLKTNKKTKPEELAQLTFLWILCKKEKKRKRKKEAQSSWPARLHSRFCPGGLSVVGGELESRLHTNHFRWGYPERASRAAEWLR